ncbi:MAG: hypothetical protein ABID54_08000 [Pseudomonadota bacterium]
MEEETLNIDYVRDIVESGDCWTAFIYGNFSGVAFQSDTKLALVMPMGI